MPRPLSTLNPDEQRLYGDLAAQPLDAVTSQVLADAAAEQGEQARADLLRREASLAVLELLRGRSLTDEESARVAARLHALLTQETVQAATERELSAALGAPQRGQEILQLLDTDGNLDVARLREQYDVQVTLLASLGLLEDQNGHLGITALDGQFHPLPSLEAIQARLQTPALHTKISQGFNQLLLVPFGLPLQRLIEAWCQDLRRNEHLLPEGLNSEEPVWLWQEGYGIRSGQGPDEDGRLVYSPQRFEQNHGGRTKAALLAADPSAGWQVLLTEGSLTETPRAGQGQTLAGRRQVEAGRSPNQYLADCPHDEVGWTPEAYIAAFLSTLERTGGVLDTQTLSFLTASYLPASGASGYVPDAFWGPGDRRAYLGGRHPGVDRPRIGARAAVRVV